MSAGVILVDEAGRVLLQLRDDKPDIMYPGHWGITGGAANAGETPEQTARREVTEETGLTIGRIEPFRAYYFSETPLGGKRSTKKSADYEVYVFHAPCATPAEELVCGEGRELRFFAPDEIPTLDIAYNHREVLEDFYASPAYRFYMRGGAFGPDDGDGGDPRAAFRAAIEAGDDWFEALTRAIAAWQAPAEVVEGRPYHYLLGGEAFDWLLLAERLIGEAEGRVPAEDAERLLFAGAEPGARERIGEERLRELIGEAKHRAHLNYVYGVIVEEALQYAVELEVSKERATVNIRDPRFDEAVVDPVYERVYGRPRSELLREFRDEERRRKTAHITLSELREFMYWLFKYRVKNQERARVASDTRKALVQLSAMEAAARRRAQRREAEPAAEPISVGAD